MTGSPVGHWCINAILETDICGSLRRIENTVGKQFRLLSGLLTEYLGPVVRIAPNQLDFDTETAHTAVHRDRAANVKKSDWYKLEPAFSGDFSVQTVIDKKEHDFRRRVLQPAFSDSALRAQEQFIDNNVRIFLAKAGEDVQSDGWTSPKEFSELITRWGFDFISDLAFGSRFGLLEDETHRYLPNLLKWASHFVYYVGRSFCRFNLSGPALTRG